jgi:hypothetical protein
MFKSAFWISAGIPSIPAALLFFISLGWFRTSSMCSLLLLRYSF